MSLMKVVKGNHLSVSLWIVVVLNPLHICPFSRVYFEWTYFVDSFVELIETHTVQFMLNQIGGVVKARTTPPQKFKTFIRLGG